MRKIFQWFYYSSKDPQKVSLSLKAGIPFLMLLGLGNYVTIEETEGIIDGTANLIMVGGQFATAGIALYGMVRKVWLTVKTNYTW